MAKRREHRLWTSGLAIMLLTGAGPLAAQTAPATNDAVTLAPTPTPTPSPAPADGNLIGPPQLRDFNLNGTVTRRADPVTTAPAPAPSASTSRPGPSPTPGRAATAPASSAPSAAAPARPTPRVAAPDSNLDPSSVTVALPPPAPAESPGTGAGAGVDLPATAVPEPAPASGGSRWPWLLAVLAAALAAAFLAWRKRQAASSRYSYAGVSELLGAEPTPAPPPLPRAASSSPPRAAAPTPRPAAPPLPRATPAPPPRAAAPASRPAAPPPRPATPAPLPVAPAAQKPPQPIDGGIVATGLRPKLAFELRPLRAETDDQRGAALLFDVIVINNGHAPARDVLVESQLVNAGPRQDEEIGRFFREPVGRGERLPVIPPMGRISLKTRLSIPGDKMSPIEIDGRQLFVPLVAFNALYRWNGGDEQDSASFLVGRGADDGGKMAPFRLDQGAKSWTGLGARPHSMGLQR